VHRVGPRLVVYARWRHKRTARRRLAPTDRTRRDDRVATVGVLDLGEIHANVLAGFNEGFASLLSFAVEALKKALAR
jgi:hypothetical protein